MTRTILASCCALILGLLSPAALALGAARSQLVASGFAEPLFATAPPDDARIFVVERAGRIRVVKQGALLATPFLDLTGQVSVAGEGGLLGLAFPADYAQSGLFYVYYTDLANQNVVARFAVSVSDRDLANPASRLTVIAVPHPAGRTNHHGGTVAFGADGFLYLGLGDGGGSYDPDENAQNPQRLLGKMLRLDVGPIFAPGSLVVPGAPYRIPADNPWAGAAGVLPQIWAFGLRNPYRFAFDRATGDLWIADVGQVLREEIDFEAASDPGGRNYGWDVKEGTLCNATDPAPSPACASPALTDPIYEYPHANGNCSITGGGVQRVPVSPLTGHYFFADYCTGRVWSRSPTGVIVDRTAELGAAAGTPYGLVGFGESGSGTLLLVNRATGSIYRILPADPACGDGVDNDRDGLVDAPSDPGCSSSSATTESPACDDGLDNDGDGLFDWDGAGRGAPDPQCGGVGWGSETAAAACGLGVEVLFALAALATLRVWRGIARGTPG